MTKINLTQKRNPGDSILVTWGFIRQEFIPLFKYFAILCLPFIVFGQMLHYLISVYAYTGNVDRDVLFIGQLVWSILIGFVLICWVQLFALSYLRVYLNKQQLAGGEPVALPEVLKMMSDKLRISLVWSLCATLIIGVASFLFLIPGIYLGVGLIFTIYYIVLKDAPLSIMTKSVELIHGNWWETFGYLLLPSLVIGVCGYLFLPVIFNAAFGVFTGNFFQEFDIVILALFATIGSCLIMVVLFIAIGMKFFTLCDRQKSYAVLNRLQWEPEYN